MHKSTMPFDSYGGVNEGNEAIIDVSPNNPRDMADKDGMATLSMEVSTVGMTWSGVASPYRS